MIGVRGLSLSGERSRLTRAALVALNKFGTDAHVWIPGIGYFNGLQAGNYIDSAGTQAGLVDNPVGRANDAVGAITATQGTTANKPILRRGAVNLLLRSEEFNSAPWGASNASASQDVTTSPTGTQTADSVVENTATSTHRIAQSYTKPASAIAFTFSVYLKANTRTFASIRIGDGPNTSSCDVAINLSTGAIDTPTATGTFSSPSAQVSNVGNGWYRLSLSGTSNTDTSLISIVYLATSLAKAPSYLGDGTSGIYIWGAQLELGSTASEYIPTTTAAASSSSGNYYWQFDGSNDSLALSSVPFQMADDHCVVAGANATNGTAATVFATGNTGSNNDVIAMDYTANFFRVWWRDTALTVESLSSPTTRAQQNIVGSMRKIGNSKIGRINGTTYGSGTVVLGASTLNTTGIGVLNRTTAGAYMTGSIYPVIAIKGTVSDADLLVLERWVGSLSGVSI